MPNFKKLDKFTDYDALITQLLNNQEYDTYQQKNDKCLSLAMKTYIRL